MPDNFIANPGAGGSTFAADEIGVALYPRSKITLGADGVNDGDVSASNPMPIAGAVSVSNMVAQGLTDAQLRATAVPTRVSSYNYPISTGNSSTTQLTAGSSFTGTIETAQDQPSISILLTSDQPTTITLRQFIDIAGTFAAPDIVFYVPAGQGFSRSLGINGNFLRVIAQNTGASTTTTFNLNVAFGTLGDADNSGVMPTTELPLVLTGAAAQTAVVNNILSPVSGSAGTTVSGFRTASVQVVSTGTAGAFIFEQSLDNVNWIPLPVFNAALVTGVPITAAITASASAIIYTFPIRGNLVRLRISTLITGGSIQAFTRLSTEPWTAAAQLVASNTAGNLLAQVSGTVGVTGYPTAAASADALANPTVTKIDSTTLLFNGTTWDRQRNNLSIAHDLSSARVASGNGLTFTNHNGRGVAFWLNVTAVSGTTPTMTVRIQWSPDNGTTWLDMDTTNLQTVSITGTSNHVLRVAPGLPVTANLSANQIAPRLMRLAWTIGGTTPSFTFVSWANTTL